MRVPRNRDLVRRAVHQLPARQFFHQIGIGIGAFHQLDTMRKPVALGLDLRQLLGTS